MSFGTEWFTDGKATTWFTDGKATTGGAEIRCQAATPDCGYYPPGTVLKRLIDINRNTGTTIVQEKTATFEEPHFDVQATYVRPTTKLPNYFIYAAGAFVLYYLFWSKK